MNETIVDLRFPFCASRNPHSSPMLRAAAAYSRLQIFQQWNLRMPKLWNYGLHAPVQGYGHG